MPIDSVFELTFTLRAVENDFSIRCHARREFATRNYRSHSARSAMMGSTLVARCAGMRQATNDTALMIAAVPRRIAKWSGGTSNKTFSMAFPASHAPCSAEPGSPTTSGAVAKDGKAREGRDVTSPLVVIGQRRAIVLDSGFRIGVEDCYEPIGLRKRKRTQQNGINHREDGEVRSETDRDRGEHGYCERRSLAQLAKSEGEIVHE